MTNAASQTTHDTADEGHPGLRRHSLYFHAERHVEVVEESVPPPAPGKLLVRSIASAISTGTELLVYRGDVPADLPVDDTLQDLPHQGFDYPLKYGYTTVGRVEHLGSGVDPAWKGKLVFAFHPHESLFEADPASLQIVPEGIEVEDALFLANMETVVNLVLDGAPRIGERVAVFGLGIVGVLTTALLARFPHGGLAVLDPCAPRRDLELDATAVLDPGEPDLAQRVQRAFGAEADNEGADLVFELSGKPEALDQAIAVAGFHGRVVIGSWYGDHPAHLHLGGRFHRSRMRLIVSQVSSIAPELRGRWTHRRRFDLAWKMIRQLRPSRWISHRFPIERAGEAYDLLDRNNGRALVAILTYSAVAS